MFDKDELACLEELINEEIKNYFDSGYEIKGSYITMLRNMLKKLHLKEYYNYDKWEHKLGV